MGEAKRRAAARADAYATGQVWRTTDRCPRCNTDKVKRINPATMPKVVAKHFTAELACCLLCETWWEPFPAAGHVEDPCVSEPCGNCAFRPGSPEQADKAKWAELMESFKGHGWVSSQFYCHKEVPIDMELGAGNFLFPRKPVTMDGETVRNPDSGKPVTTFDTARMRLCSGFLRMIRAQGRKQSVDTGEPDAE